MKPLLTWRGTRGEKKGGRWIRVQLADLPSFHNRSVYLGDMIAWQFMTCRKTTPDITTSILTRMSTEDGVKHQSISVTGEIATLSVSPSVELFRFSNQRFFFCLEVKASVHPSSTVRWGVWLNCQTSCQDRLIWFKDGQPITSTEFQDQMKDAGNCTCAVEREELLQSDPVTLDVQCKYVKYSV